MTETASSKPSDDRGPASGRLWLVVSGFLFLLAIVLPFATLIVLDSAEVEEVVTRDDHWSLYQVQAEYQKLLIALHDAASARPGVPKADIQQRLDILYSRIDVITAGSSGKRFHGIPWFEQAMKATTEAIQRCDEALANFGPTVGVDDASTILAILAPLGPKLQNLSLGAISYGNSEVDRIRASRKWRVVAILGLLSLATIAAAAASIVLAAQNRRLEKARISLLRTTNELEAAKTQAELSETRFRDFARSTADWFWETDAALRFHFLSKNAGTVTDDPPLSLYGKSQPEALATLSDGFNFSAHLKDLEHRRPFRDFEIGTTDRAGNPAWLRASGVPIFGPGGEFLGYRGSASNVTKEKLAEARTREFEDRLVAAIESVPVGLALYDRDENLVLCNNRYKSLAADIGFSAETGRSLGEVVGQFSSGSTTATKAAPLEDERDRHSGGRGTSSPGIVRKGDRWLEFSRHDAGDGNIFVIVQDVTAQQQAEERLRQSQKMEVVGQLTGGIAHDFNNLLTAIIGNLDIIKDSSGGDQRIERSLDTALRASARGAELTQRLLAFSRKQSLTPKPTDINFLIDDVCRLARRTISENINIRKAGNQRLWQAMVDPGQLENALLNICLNARDAMPDGGTLSVETDNTMLNANTIGHEEVSPGDYVCITVSDTGTGMSADVLRNAFNPFFTTKDVGKGSGLGLSMVYGFAKQSEGHVTLESQAGQRTSVRLYLPRASNADFAERPTTDKRKRSILPGGNETILVVEDDPDVRDFIVEGLRMLGYTVLEAQDGPEALAQMENTDMIDLLLSDVVLPRGMSGGVIAREFSRRYPKGRVLLSSGYPEHISSQEDWKSEFPPLLNKPYRREVLANRIREVLAGNTA